MMAENMQNGMVRLKEGGEGRGLFPVLQPQGNPYAESHPTGDAWLQSMWREGKFQNNAMGSCADSQQPARVIMCALTLTLLLGITCVRAVLWSHYTLVI